MQCILYMKENLMMVISMTEIIALTSYDWEFTEHYLYDVKEMPDKKELDRIWKKAYADAKSKIRSGIRTKPTSDEILREMVKLLKEKDIYPLKIWNYDVDNKEMEEDDRL